MNILRKTRKSNIKISRRRLVLLIFSLIMTSFAWIAYFKILQTNFEVHINSWNISIFVDENKNGVAEESEEKDKDAAIEIDFLELYPGMNQEVMDVIIKNNGETPSTIDYIISDIKFLGNDYTIQENAEEYRANNPDLFCLQKNEYVDSGGIITYDLINESLIFPFKFIIEHTGNIEGGAEGYLKVKAVWLSSIESNETLTEEEIEAKNEVDSEWGYRVAEFIENNPDISPLQFKVKINATGLPRSSRFVLTQNLTPDNYGDYVDYPIDLNNDGDTTNDWQIFYEDNENVYIIADEYISNSLVSEDIMLKGTDTYSAYGLYFNENTFTEDMSIDQSIINKYMLTSAMSSSNNNYKATSQLLNTTNWSSFVATNYAESAVGAPTIEMFIKSWNQKYILSENHSELNSIWKIHSTGYKINDELESYVLGYDNAKLYFPYTTSEVAGSECFGYWLASPSANNDKSLINVLSSGKISFGEINSNNGIGIRPVVALKVGIKGTSQVNADEINIWSLEEP